MEEELKSPPPCPRTVTLRRNPNRKARPTPSSVIPLPLPISSPVPSSIPSFPVEDLLSIRVDDKVLPDLSLPLEDLEKPTLESLKVFLRIRPLTLRNDLQKRANHKEDEAKYGYPKNHKSKSGFNKKVKTRNQNCITVNDSHSVTLSPPQNLQDAKRVKSEVYGGFSHVFPANSSQIEVYDRMVKQLVEEFLNGESGMLAALGPSGSGKTHTVFGSARNPGMVTHALRKIFASTQRARKFYLSIFEICSEKGKSEKMYDLLGEGMELYLQQSTVKGLQEVMINDVQQAESLIACAMLKRATAMTHSNNQSSRSQCVINITCSPKITEGASEYEPNKAVLTIVDLAGAEREKKTGNQGHRLLESNFINNTSMVFGLCLRSLLEHQKNPKRPLHKHFQSSLLTRYLRAYLEGKKRMALVLTVKSGEEDYLDTSNLLKQASPYTQIRFKRPIQTFSRVEQPKRMKFCDLEASVTNERRSDVDQPRREENVDSILTDILVKCEDSICSKPNGGGCLKNDSELARKDRECEITLKFAKALWTVLKQYKVKLEMAEHEICCLKGSLSNEQTRCLDLENEVMELKRESSNKKEVSEDVSTVEFGTYCSSDTKGSQSTEFQEEEVSGPSETFCTGAIACEGHLTQHPGDQLECPQTCYVDSKTSSEFETDDAVTNIWEVDELVALLTHGNEKCEEANTIVGTDKYLSQLEDIEEENNHSHSNENDSLVLNDEEHNHSHSNENDSLILNDEERNNSCTEEESDHSEFSISHCQASAGSSISKTTLSSPSSPLVRKDENQLPEELEEMLDPQVVLKPEEDASHAQAPELPACYSSQSTKKPKRRLLPSSCILLRDIGSLAIEDENDKPKGVKGEKKMGVGISNKTKGSLSLLSLLRSNLHP